jgi:MerR family mercuric resistance operon transcriptional regulator
MPREPLTIEKVADRTGCNVETIRYYEKEHLRDIRLKIRDLRRMERTLGDLAGRCSGRVVPDCPIIEALQE